jgi:hypothetical protein
MVFGLFKKKEVEAKTAQVTAVQQNRGGNRELLWMFTLADGKQAFLQFKDKDLYESIKPGEKGIVTYEGSIATAWQKD